MFSILSNWFVAIALMVVLQLGDIVTTINVLKRGGRESNGIISFMMERLGPKGWIVAKLIIACLAILICYHFDLIWIIWLYIPIYAYVVYQNHKITQ